jgi:hypothetical protein
VVTAIACGDIVAVAAGEVIAAFEMDGVAVGEAVSASESLTSICIAAADCTAFTLDNTFVAASTDTPLTAPISIRN